MDAITPHKKRTSKSVGLVRLILRQFKSPPKLRLSAWAERHIVLPAAQNPLGGKYRNWPYLIDILDDIGDPSVEQVSLMKAARIGFTKGLIIALAAKVVNDPCPIGLLVPRDQDATDAAVDEIEPLFRASPALAALLPRNREDGRTTLTRKTFTSGATLKILPALSPSNLRRHGFKVLYADEIDAMAVTPEGDPLTLAVNRTLAYPDRKLVWGSTPTEEDVSNIERKYKESDQRVFEVPCPSCGTFFEILWRHIQWPKDEPDKAYCVCPSGCVIEERQKRPMVMKGRWRATCPQIKNHHGYKLNALVSLLPNTGWGQLAANFLQAKRGGPTELQVFVNQSLAETWRVSLNRLGADKLEERVEPIGLDRIPREIVMLTAGADVQDDRLEVSVLGWTKEIGSPYVLAHHVIDGSTLDDATWREFDVWLKRTYRHPNGWQLGIDACAIDSGGSEGRTQRVYDFAGARYRRRVFAIKSVVGARAIWARAQRVKKNARLYIVGHDQIKTMVMERLALEPVDDEGRVDVHAVRLSEDLPADWFEQVTGETRRVRYVKNRAVIEFLPKRAGQRVEALDALCYGWAVRYSPSVKVIDLAERAARVVSSSGDDTKRRSARDWSAALNG